MSTSKLNSDLKAYNNRQAKMGRDPITMERYLEAFVPEGKRPKG